MAEIIEMHLQGQDPTELFSEQFFGKVIAESPYILDEDTRNKLDEMFADSKHVLERVMNAEQLALLDEMVVLIERNMRYSIPVCFLFGVRAGHPQENEDEITETVLFFDYVFEGFLAMPEMYRYAEYHKRLERINEIDKYVRSGLDAKYAEDFLSVRLVLDQRVHSAQIYAFNLGRQYAPQK